MNAIPWYHSAVVRGVVVSILGQIFALTHIASYVTGPQIGAIADALIQIAAIASAVYAAHARMTKPMPPVVISQKAADVVNNGNGKTK